MSHIKKIYPAFFSCNFYSLIQICPFIGGLLRIGMRFFHGSIRKKIVIVILLSVIPLLSIVLITELVNRSNAELEAQKDALNTLKGFVEIQKRMTSSTKTLLKTLASIPDIKRLDGKRARAVFSTLLKANPVYSNVILVDTKGNCIAAGRNHSQNRKMNFSDRLQFKQAIKAEDFATGEFVRGRSSKRPIFSYGMAVKDEKGKVVGAIITGIDLNHYGDLFRKSTHLKVALLEICDHKGVKLFGYPDSGHGAGERVDGFYYSVISGMTVSGVRFKSYDKKRKIFVFESLRLNKRLAPYMYIYMGFDQSQISSRANSILYRMVATSLLSLIFAIAIAWFVGGKGIAEYIEKLSKIAGEYGKDIDCIKSGIDYSDGEVGELAKSFDSMALKLKEREKDIIEAISQFAESERRFREIIEEVSAISIQGYDEQRRVTFWNPASEVLYGYSEEEAMGRKLEDLIIPTHLIEEHLEMIEEWMKNGNRIPAGELVLRDKDGNDVPVFSSHVMHETRNGKEMFCIDIDLKPLKQSENDKQVLMDRLRQSQKMEAIGTLAGGIAHDFNNILFPILGHTEMLLEETKEEDKFTLTSLSQIHSSVLRARELVRQILTFSRQEITEYRPMRIQSVLKEVIKLLRATLPKNIEIKQYIDNDCPMINGDGTQIHQIVMNLATNSYHAIGDCKGEIDIRLEEIEIGENEHEGVQAGKAVCLSVSDSGSGIDPEIIDSIFDPFFTTKESGKGTGMGLSVVHGIVKNMGGNIVLKSNSENGALFEAVFPAVDESSYQVKEIEYIDISFFRGTERLLFIDDEDGIIKMEKTALERLGYTVIMTNDPAYAIKLFKKNPEKYDLVVTDMAMPQITGEELTREIKKIRPDIRVIMCTGFSEKITKERAKEIGIWEVIIKPVTIKELAGTIRKVLDEKN